MKLEIHVYQYDDNATKEILRYLRTIHQLILSNHLQINSLLNTIIMKQSEAVQALADLSAKLDKVNSEIQAEIKALNDAVANQENVTPELQEAVESVTSKAQALDDLIPDAPVE